VAFFWGGRLRLSKESVSSERGKGGEGRVFSRRAWAPGRPAGALVHRAMVGWLVGVPYSCLSGTPTEKRRAKGERASERARERAAAHAAFFVLPVCASIFPSHPPEHERQPYVSALNRKRGRSGRARVKRTRHYKKKQIMLHDRPRCASFRSRNKEKQRKAFDHVEQLIGRAVSGRVVLQLS
jgi:hypothetical protein